MVESAPNRIYAVVVTFYPDESALRALLTTLTPQTAGIVVVDNTPAPAAGALVVCSNQTFPYVRLIELRENKGVAHALNVGIKAALDAGATHVVLSDQDSFPAPDMVVALLNAETALLNHGRRLGAVGPTFTDRRTGITFPFQTVIPGKFFYGHQRTDTNHPIVDTLSLITSGTLIRASVMTDVGLMREDFFIDNVDIEWCHRARAAGYSLYGIGSAVMFHELGERALDVWYFGWRREPAYDATRVYYSVRNSIALCRIPTIRKRWKLRHGWYCFGFVYAQAIFGDRRLRVLYMAIRGLFDGLRKRMGPLRS